MSSWLTESVDWKRNRMKNTRSSRVRKRTSGPDRPELPDRRVQRTKASLRNALIGLAREKPYRTIAVKEILERANVTDSPPGPHRQTFSISPVGFIRRAQRGSSFR